MRALELRDFHDMRIVERNDPSPGTGEVLVRTLATGICGSDLHGYTGENGRRSPGQVMGHETAGRITALGASVDGAAQIDDLVTINPVLGCGACSACRGDQQQHCPTKRVIGVDPTLISSFAELIAVPTRNVVPLSEQLEPAHGALVEPLAVAHHAVRRGRLTATDSLLIIGGGPIGQSAIVAASQACAGDIFVSEPNPERRHRCERLGARPLDPNQGSIAEQLAAIHDPIDVVIDAVGVDASMADALSASALNARIVLVGMGSLRLNLAAFELSVAERTVTGSYTYSASEFAEMAEFVSSHPTHLDQLIDNLVPLIDAPDAFASMVKGELGSGKVILTF